METDDLAKAYPAVPIVGVGGVIVRDGRAVIVRRGQEPRKGEWSLPGGLVELGESLVDATRREMKEETGLDVEVGALVEMFDRIHHDEGGRVRYHFVIADYLCLPVGGALVAGSDVTDARWVTVDEIDEYVISPHAAAVLRRGLELGRPASSLRMSPMILSRDNAWTLLTEWTQSDSLRKHALAVEAAVRGYARRMGEPEEEWAIVALLHDFDYERYPSLEEHPYRGCEHLTSLGYPEWVTRAILSHADYSGVPRETPLEKTLFACDEMAGFITAAALVRPSKSILDLEALSVKKRMKDKAFARNVPREHLQAGADTIGVPLDEHIGNVISFMREQADALGLRGNL